jgi:universal stress protein G
MTAPQIQFRNIMVPVDMRHAEESDKAIATAVRLGAVFDATCHMLTVAHPFGEHVSDMPETQQRGFEALVARKASELNATIKPIFRSHENPIHIITRTSEDAAIDLIVMASHDPRLTDHLFGSNASQVSLHAPCSVMVVR